MDWLKGMNKAVEYIENNLSQHISYESMARSVGCSIYEFSRIFSFMTGMSISEYVRRRRLSQAVFDIQNGSEKIINIALKYCYESPAAFTRAFKELHGTSPLSARKMNVPLKTYPTIQFNFSIKGEKEMDFKIVEKPAFSVVGIKLNYKYGSENEPEKLISEFWRKTTKETYDVLSSLADGDIKGFLGIFSRRSHGGDADYLIAVESSKEAPEGFIKINIPSVKWVVLEKDSDPISFQNRIRDEWLPLSGYSRAESIYPTFECCTKINMPNGVCNEMWFPVDTPADKKRKFNTALAELAKIEERFSKNKPIEIDLATMIPHQRATKDIKLNYTDNGAMVMHTMIGDGRVGTPQEFSVPLKIEMRAKTDSTNMRIYYSHNQVPKDWTGYNCGGFIMLNWWHKLDTLRVHDMYCPNMHSYENAGHIPINEFIDLEWILGEKVMAVKVNGEVRAASCEFDYIEALKNGTKIAGHIYPAPGRGSTVTVERLRITELKLLN